LKKAFLTSSHTLQGSYNAQRVVYAETLNETDLLKIGFYKVDKFIDGARKEKQLIGWANFRFSANDGPGPSSSTDLKGHGLSPDQLYLKILRDEKLADFAAGEFGGEKNYAGREAADKYLNGPLSPKPFGLPPLGYVPSIIWALIAVGGTFAVGAALISLLVALIALPSIGTFGPALLTSPLDAPACHFRRT